MLPCKGYIYTDTIRKKTKMAMKRSFYSHCTIDLDMQLCYSSLGQCIRLDMSSSSSQHSIRIRRDANNNLGLREEHNPRTQPILAP